VPLDPNATHGGARALRSHTIDVSGVSIQAEILSTDRKRGIEGTYPPLVFRPVVPRPRGINPFRHLSSLLATPWERYWRPALSHQHPPPLWEGEGARGIKKNVPSSARRATHTHTVIVVTGGREEEGGGLRDVAPRVRQCRGEGPGPPPRSRGGGFVGPEDDATGRLCPLVPNIK